MPPGTRAELIDGIVYLNSSVGYDHGDSHLAALVWLNQYALRTPGVHVLNNSTVIFDAENELQPDSGLHIRSEWGGRTWHQGRYIAGVPELVVEVSRSTRYVDLGPKFMEYESAGVLEYIVRAIDPDEVIWHILESSRFIPIAPDADGLLRSRAFPGLWLDPKALLAEDQDAVRQALDRGLDTPEHAAFVARLAAKRDNP
jgi:Uma2 family endonuclease